MPTSKARTRQSASTQPSSSANKAPTSTSNSTANSTSVEFAAAARLLTRAARDLGLIGPSFRCPPRLVGVDRSIRRTAGAAVVSVRLRGRPFVAVLADMIEGVVVANRLTAPEADRLRSSLWQATGANVGANPAGSSASSGSAAAPGARVA